MELPQLQRAKMIRKRSGNDQEMMKPSPPRANPITKSQWTHNENTISKWPVEKKEDYQKMSNKRSEDDQKMIQKWVRVIPELFLSWFRVGQNFELSKNDPKTMTAQVHGSNPAEKWSDARPKNDQAIISGASPRRSKDYEKMIRKWSKIDQTMITSHFWFIFELCVN